MSKTDGKFYAAVGRVRQSADYQFRIDVRESPGVPGIGVGIRLFQRRAADGSGYEYRATPMGLTIPEDALDEVLDLLRVARSIIVADILARDQRGAALTPQDAPQAAQ